MSAYELLDHIADSVNPILALLALLLPWLPTYRRSVPPWLGTLAAPLGMGVAYAGHAIDQATGAWPAMSLDYSGHSAVCVALLVPLAHLSRRWFIAAITIGLAYAALMVYQRYHTVSDIFTTAVPVGLACELIWRLAAHTGLKRV